ncbi:hypothetical protein NP233_g12464 [Leucocoprinus birnbaumii]|uniref:Uncharacterized protein n=1 Tax=Leucocoprinus birnbaumii TaxID=56174 RepID=A0AAD5YJF0_9AGAR|nr:hypothetical protein NP233_g12464 [Leucocoprinus birnbaumii]
MSPPGSTPPPIATPQRQSKQQSLADHQFFVVCWYDNDSDPRIHTLQGSRDWPSWDPYESPSRFLSSFNGPEPATLKLEHYVIDRRHWSCIEPPTAIIVARDSYCFLRRTGVVVPDIDKYIQRYTKRSPHFRLNMKDERLSVRVKVEKMKAVEALGEASEDEALQHQQKRPRLSSPITMSVPLLRARAPYVFGSPTPLGSASAVSLAPASLSSGGSSTGSSSSSASANTSSSASSSLCGTPVLSEASLFITSGSSSSSGQPTPVTPSDLPSLVPSQEADVSDLQQWPRGLFACDIVEGFRAIDKLRDGNLATRFRQVFKAKFTSRTYYNHCECYLWLSTLDLEEAVNAGRTPDGLWMPVYSNYRQHNK